MDKEVKKREPYSGRERKKEAASDVKAEPDKERIDFASHQQTEKKIKLDYFQKKRQQNETKRSTILKSEEEVFDQKRRENNLRQAHYLLDLANFEKEREKRHQLEKEKREKEKDVDYKSILRDARRVERSELNKALDTREKLRQQRLKEEDNMDHEMIQISKETKESDWEQYDQQRNAHRNERESLAKKRLNQRHEELVSFRKQIHLQQQEQEDVERRREEWVTIYEVRNKEENALLPETVQEEILVNVLQHEGSEDGEETIDFRSERLKKNKNNTTASHLRTVDQDIYDTKRIFLDNSLSRAKNHRRDRQ